MTWGTYARAVLAFNLAGFVVLCALLRLHGLLPLNPDGIGGMAPDLAFNTAVSFVTNTNWQAYSGEAQLSYPKTIRVDDGTEFISCDLDLWACANDVTLDFSRPGKPTDNGLI